MGKPHPEHEYHNKTNPALSYIIGDADAARLACRGDYINPAIEIKYLTQITTASAILLWRYAKDQRRD